MAEFTGEQIRKEILDSIPKWIQCETLELEWEGVMQHPKTSPALRELASDKDLFGKFFSKVAKQLRATNALLTIGLLYARDCASLEDHRNCYERLDRTPTTQLILMATRLLLKFHSPQPEITVQQMADMRFGVPAPLVVRSKLFLQGHQSSANLHR